MAEQYQKGWSVGLLQRLKCALNQSSWDQMLRDFMAGNDAAPDGSIDVSGDAALKFTAVFGCCRVLAETFASVPIAEYKKIEDGDRKKTDETGLFDLFHNVPNDEMSSYNFHEMGMYQINLGGNLVAIRQKNRLGGLLGLNPIEWHRVEIKRDQAAGNLVYKVDGKSDQVYTRDQVFHVPGPSFNGVIGMSPIEYAAQAIRLGLTYEQFGVKFFKNGALPSGIFKHPGFLKDEAFKRLKEDIERNYQGLINAGKPILAEDGLDFVQLTMKLADAELLQSKKFQIEDICRVYRVPLHLVQNLDKATFSNIEQQSLEFVMYTMLPWVRRWEECINCQLLTPTQRRSGYYFEYNLSGLLRGDQKSMAEAFAIGRQWGWLSVNDIRRLLNMNSVENGDIYLQPMNMIEAGEKPEDPGTASVDPQTPDSSDGKSADDQKKELVDEIYKLIESRGK